MEFFSLIVKPCEERMGPRGGSKRNRGNLVRSKKGSCNFKYYFLTDKLVLRQWPCRGSLQKKVLQCFKKAREPLQIFHFKISFFKVRQTQKLLSPRAQIPFPARGYFSCPGRGSKDLPSHFLLCKPSF